jgi:predicted DCC family thiol-disulfide oxidoreductase YuxK
MFQVFAVLGDICGAFAKRPDCIFSFLHFGFCYCVYCNLVLGKSRHIQLVKRMSEEWQGPIILFDAECVLCSANAKFVLKHDKHARFRLASMQGETGSALYRKNGIDPRDPSTMIVIEGDRVKLNSDAVLSIYEGLGFPWRLATMFRLVPSFIRDGAYRLVARNRYRIFGKRESCWIAPAEYRDRILR